MLKRIGVFFLPLMALVGYYVYREESAWTCPKCAYENTRPYPRYSCQNCSWPYDD